MHKPLPQTQIMLINLIYQVTFAPIADYNLVAKAKKAADESGAISHVGNVLSSDTFYNADSTFNDSWKKMGILGIEMESAGLYFKCHPCK